MAHGVAQGVGARQLNFVSRVGRIVCATAAMCVPGRDASTRWRAWCGHSLATRSREWALWVRLPVQLALLALIDGCTAPPRRDNSPMNSCRAAWPSELEHVVGLTLAEFGDGVEGLDQLGEGA